jgi:hypothetical protein
MRRLTVRDWSSTDPIPHLLISTCPDLRYLESGCFIEGYMIAATLEVVSVRIRTLADLGTLSKCTHLRSLTLRRAGMGSMPEPELRNHFLQLSCHLGPHLVDLDITLSLEELIAFVPYIPSFSALDSVALAVHLPPEEPTSRIATPFPIQGILNLCVLSLKIFHFDMMGERYRNTLGHILDYFSQNQLLQNLHTFRCDTFTIPVELAQIASLLRELSNVRVLDLILGPYKTDIGSNHPPILMPNLLELYLRPTALRACIAAPNLLRLGRSRFHSEGRYATLHLPEHFGVNISHLVVDRAISKAISKAYSEGVGPKFKSLQTIQIADSSNAEWVSHLSSVRVIDFIYPIESPNFFFLDLLRYPGALPNLSTIKTHRSFSWELIFEVLRQRNAAKMHRIQEFVFPNFPVLTILS